MIRWLAILFVATVFVATQVGVCVADDAPESDASLNLPSGVRTFLTTYCQDCHGPEDQSGDRRFDQLAGRIDRDDVLIDYQDIVDQLNLNEMPPEEAAQPSDQERLQVIRAITKRIERYHATVESPDQPAVLRRLNAREYRNTIAQLFQLDTTIFDPTEKFPTDQTVEHLDNVGDTLVISGHLLARYLEAADLIVAKAMGDLDKPETQTWVFRDGFRQQPEIDQVHRKTNRFNHMTLYDVIGADKHEGAYGPILEFSDGVPKDGMYEIQFQAAAVNREHPYDPEFLGTDAKEPLRLGIRPGHRDVGNLHLPQPIEPLLAEIELSDQPETYTVQVHLDAGYTPRFTFRNGLMDARTIWSRVIKNYREQFPKDIKKGIVAARYNAIAHGKLPQIHIDDIHIRGPIHTSWPTASQRALFGEEWDGEQTEFDATETRKRLATLAARAYRRPATDEEIDRVMRVYDIRRDAGKDWPHAYADAAKAILCSPAFLYLEESRHSEAYGLASRLSYFLWSSMPDDELLRLAAAGDLEQPEILRQQIKRMLADSKSDAFVNGFLGSWLGLRELGSSPPDRGDFRDFYQYDLDAAMRRETYLFTRHLMDQNLSVRYFLDSDFTFVNRPLARHYGIDPPDGYQFERVTFDDRRRGGLLGQASILTLTANGIDTSPIVRGVWLLENLLGTPPTPPPPDVEPLDPDVRGATTIRDQLEKHRSNASCNECHRKIDPLGFALENFDPIGGWRNSYGRGKPIDASGELPGGKRFDDIVDFKQVLIDRSDLFARAITEKLLAYAKGRRLGPRDRPTVDRILAATKDQGYPLADLIVEVGQCLN